MNNDEIEELVEEMPDDDAGILVEDHFKIFDPESDEVLLNSRG